MFEKMKNSAVLKMIILKLLVYVLLITSFIMFGKGWLTFESSRMRRDVTKEVTDLLSQSEDISQSDWDTLNDYLADYDLDISAEELVEKEIEVFNALKDAEINKAKEVLAYEVTKLVHGAEEAEKAQSAARALFAGGGDMANVPTTTMEKARFEGEGIGVVSLIKELKLVPSNGEGFRTIEQGGLSINDEKVTDKKLMITLDTFKEDGTILIKKGKKTFHKVQLQ